MDVVGIGALNLDYVVRGSSAGLPVARGAEGRVPASVVRPFLGGSLRLGGSAFNTVTALARFRLRLGFVGVVGVPPAHADRLAELGIDHRYVHHDDALSGTCVSVVEDADRTLLIHPGANDFAGDYLKREFEPLVKYLAAARIVHVTSFLDPVTPAVLAALVRASGTRLSLDPGHEWVSAPSPAVRELIGAADYLFLNTAEFEALGADFVSGHPGTVLVKCAEGVRSFHQGRSEWTGHEPLAPAEVVNPTGAGDAFAAGYLAAHLTADHSPSEAAALGLATARAHLRAT